jgi:hypothetical protein
MNSHLITYIATAHTDELLRQAEKARTVSRQRDGRRPSIAAVVRRAMAGVRRPTSAGQPAERSRSAGRDVTIRLAAPADDPALDRLAQLDSSSVPPPPFLIAEEDGEVRAALSLLSADAIADPFHSTAALVELLRTRAGQQAHLAAPLSPTRRATLSSRQEAV